MNEWTDIDWRCDRLKSEELRYFESKKCTVAVGGNMFIWNVLNFSRINSIQSLSSQTKLDSNEIHLLVFTVYEGTDSETGSCKSCKYASNLCFTGSSRGCKYNWSFTMSSSVGLSLSTVTSSFIASDVGVSAQFKTMTLFTPLSLGVEVLNWRWIRWPYWKPWTTAVLRNDMNSKC